MSSRRNVNRGYRQLRVWQDAARYYAITCRIFMKFPYMLRRAASNQIASVDSVHRNIAEGYCRRSINEYLQFLNYALASAGESVSGLHVYRDAKQISEGEFEEADAIAYRLENGLKRLTASLQAKRKSQEWEDSFIVEESNVTYGLGVQET